MSTSFSAFLHTVNDGLLDLKKLGAHEDSSILKWWKYEQYNNHQGGNASLYFEINLFSLKLFNALLVANMSY